MNEQSKTHIKNQQNEQCKIRIIEELKDWVEESSPAFHFFTQKFARLNKEILLVLARIISEKLNYHDLTRDYHRNKNMLFKWFDDHWDCCEPILNKVCLVDKDYNLLMKNSPNASFILESYLVQEKRMMPN